MVEALCMQLPCNFHGRCACKLPESAVLLLQVRSRFAGRSGEGEDFSPFLKALQGLGFSRKSMDTNNSHFVIFELQKAKSKAEGGDALEWPTLKACAYKKR